MEDSKNSRRKDMHQNGWMEPPKPYAPVKHKTDLDEAREMAKETYNKARSSS